MQGARYRCRRVQHHSPAACGCGPGDLQGTCRVQLWMCRVACGKQCRRSWRQQGGTRCTPGQRLQGGAADPALGVPQERFHIRVRALLCCTCATDMLGPAHRVMQLLDDVRGRLQRLGCTQAQGSSSVATGCSHGGVHGQARTCVQVRGPQQARHSLLGKASLARIRWPGRCLAAGTTCSLHRTHLRLHGAHR